MNYKHFGVMLDCSRNAVMNINSLKRFIDYLEKMGYNTLEIYSEDVYEIENERYVGYLRGKYSVEEIKEIDAYAKKHNVELIPCIQTLAHFTNTCRLPVYTDMWDCNDILLIGEEKTYEFIGNIFKTISKAFSSKNVNIGMDEAHMIGLGKYLEKNGYKNPSETLLQHLKRVVEIATKYGYKPHMWSDMFFRLANGGEYYCKNVDIPQNVVENVPENLGLVYWDYYLHDDKQIYNGMMSTLKKFDRETWFAGGAWTWNGFAPFNAYSINMMKEALKSSEKNDFDNVMVTMWGDNGAECSSFSALPALFCIKKFADGETKRSVIKDEFYKTFNVKFDDFMLLDVPNYSNRKNGYDTKDPCKVLLYNDCLMGAFDKEYQNFGLIDYKKYAVKLRNASKKAGEFSYLFDTLSKLCFVLDKKADIGIRTRELYLKKDKEGLENILKDYTSVIKRLQDFYGTFMFQWNKDNKPFGWEIQDIRLGGLEKRVKYCKDKIADFISGKIDSIPELEEEILIYSNDTMWCPFYKEIVSRSSL